MDFETIVAYLNNKYMAQLPDDMTQEEFLAQVKPMTEAIEAEIIALCDEAPLNLAPSIAIAKSAVKPINKRLEREMMEETESHYHKNYADLTPEEKIHLDSLFGKVRVENTKISSSEKQKRLNYHNQAKVIFAQNVANFIAKDIAISKFYSDLQMKRQTGAILTKMAVDSADVLQIFEGVKQNDKNAKKNLNTRFNAMLSKGKAIMDEFKQEPTDEKMLEIAKTNFLDLLGMAEWQKDNIEETAQDLGLTISDENALNLTAITKKFAVSVSPLKDKISIMANPYYPKYDASTIYSLKQVITDPEFNNYLTDEESEVVEVLISNQGNGDKPDAFSQYRAKVDFNYPGNDFYRGSRSAAISRLEDAVAYQLQEWNLEDEHVEYVVDGKVATVADLIAKTSLRREDITPKKLALECALRGKKVGVLTKKDHKFVTMVTCRKGSLGFIDKVVPQPKITLKGNQLQANVSQEDGEAMRNGLQSLYNTMLSHNRWYISKKGAYGQVLDALRDALTKDLTVRSVFKNNMNNIKEKAQVYLTDRFLHKNDNSTLTKDRFESVESVLQTVMTLQEKIKGPEKLYHIDTFKKEPIEIKEDDLSDNKLVRSKVIDEDEMSENKSYRENSFNQSNALEEDEDKVALDLLK